MIINVYSFFDVKSQAYTRPFYMAHDGLAHRAFSEVIADKETAPGKYPCDFSLYKVGEFDDVRGGFEPFDKALFLANGVDYANTEVKDARSAE